MDDNEIMLADEPKAFAGAVADLRSDASCRRMLQSKVPGIPMTITPNAIDVHRYVPTEPKLFARALADLLADPSRRKALGEAARRGVELQYGVPVLHAALPGAPKNVVDRPLGPHRDFIAHRFWS